jgi:hypothetical protein
MLWLLKLTSPLVLVIARGKLSEAKGRLAYSILREVQGIVTESGIVRGTIHADGSGRYHFSSEFSAELHQRLRNVLISA